MDESRLKIWEKLFERALEIIDLADPSVFRPDRWSFGGGTVLMRRYRHRVSKDIDIFVSDPQYLGYVSPRLNDAVGALVPRHLEQANFLKLYFAEGEIDFVVSLPLTRRPTVAESIFGRQVRVETSREILAKKINYRAAGFTARDLLDFSLIVENEPAALKELRPLMREKREIIFERIAAADVILRKTFAELEVLEYKRTYDACLGIVRQALEAA